ncbi:MAG: 16S rRNA (cytosine(1402)-N(4))-methyltransferase RsmH [Planctomycetaceae bacterium]|nr:16S rRNA (cytosine(1402)-N(4))-methyltransferase RsmH [Planctomycetaceae bacterium]
MRPPRRDPFPIHQPVLPHEVHDLLDLRPGLKVVDATVGAGGHSRDILERIQPGGLLIGIDRDPMMLELASRTLGLPHPNVVLHQSSYVELPNILAEHEINGVDRILADLGLSSDQLADTSRGFSFEADGPLDLRFDTSTGSPASELLASRSAEDLSHLFDEYGEEPFSRQIATHIVNSRRQTPIQTSRDLAAVVESAIPGRARTSRHPATRVFQALRIAVNEELQHVADFVDRVLPNALVPGGRAAIITFHSLEDRLVKRAFRNREIWQPVTSKPATASSVERRQNPRSRSAKLRVAVRL